MQSEWGSEREEGVFDIESKGEEKCGWERRVLLKMGKGEEEQGERECIVLEVNIVNEGKLRGEKDESSGECSGGGGMRGNSGSISTGGIEKERICEQYCEAEEEFCEGGSVVASGKGEKRWVDKSSEVREQVFKVGKKRWIVQGARGGGMCVPLGEGKGIREGLPVTVDLKIGAVRGRKEEKFERE